MRRSAQCCRCGTAAAGAALGTGPRAVSRRVGAARRALGRGETLEESIRRHLAAKVDVRELVASRAARDAPRPGAHPEQWQLATAYVGLVPSDVDPRVPDDTPGTRWTPAAMAFDHGASCSPDASGCARSSRTRTSASRSRRRVHDLRAPRALRARRSGTRSPPRTSSACSSAAGCSSRPGSGASRAVPAAGRRRSSASRARGPRGHRPVRGLRPPATPAPCPGV